MKNGCEFFYKDTYISKTEDVRRVKIYILNLHYKVSLCTKFLAPNVSSSQDMDISKNVCTERAKRARNKRQLVYIYLYIYIYIYNLYIFIYIKVFRKSKILRN